MPPSRHPPGPISIEAMRTSTFLILALWATTVRAQEVTGTVRAEGGPSPVSGAIVILTQPSGTRHSATLTDDAGRFRLRPPSAGTFALRVDVVGYRSVTVSPFRVDSAATVTREILFPFERTPLPRVAVTAASSCARVADETGDAPQLWSEARKTLEASRIAIEERRFAVALRRYERTIGLPDSVLRASRTWTQTGVSENPFESLPPDVVARDGYSADRDSTRYYYAPDATILLSDDFVNTHCFGTRRGGPGGTIGLTFRPQRIGTRTDITGVLWLDSASAELRTLEYRYVPSIAGRQEVGGGSVAFGRYPSGVWGVQRWSIRLPVLHVNENRRRPDGALGRFVDTVVVALRETGGEVIAGGASSASAQTPDTRLTGTVFDSTSGKPLAGAMVTIEGFGRTTETDSEGRFVFDSLSDAGEVRVRAWHARLDSLALAPPVARVQLRRRGESTMQLAIPGVAEVARLRCARESRDAQRVITGILQSPTDSVRASVEVVLLERLGATGDGRDSLVRHTEITSDAGRYAFCGVQPGTQSWLLARSGPDWTDPLHINGENAPPVEVIPLRTLSPVHPAADSSQRTAAPDGAPAVILGRTLQPGPARITGWVLLPEHNESRVQVLVDDVVRASTAADGSFSIREVAAGARRLTFRAPPLAARHIALTAEPGQSQLMVVTLRMVPVVVVNLNLAPPDPRMDDFRQRRRAGGGVFIDRAQIQRRNPRQLSDLLRSVPGVRVQSTSTGLRYISTHFRRLSENPDYPEAGLCDMMLYIDGQPFQATASAADLRVRVTDLAAIEVYASAASVPREFAGHNAACGVILIWLGNRE